MKEFERINKNRFYGTVTLFLSVLIFVATVVTIIFVTDSKQKAEMQRNLENVQTREIKSCLLRSKDNLSISGSFVLGVGSLSGGSFEDIEYYFYMMGRQGYALRKLDARYVEIVPTDDKEPSIVGHFDKYGELYDNRSFNTYPKDYRYEMSHYTLYLPSDYITEEYNVDISSIVKN